MVYYMLIHQVALIRLHIKQTAVSQFVIFCMRSSCTQFPYNIEELQPLNSILCLQFCWHLQRRIVNQPNFSVCCGMMRQFSLVVLTVFAVYMNEHWRVLMLLNVHHLNTHSGLMFGPGLEMTVGPYVITECLRTVQYTDVLGRTLSLLLEDILNICKGMWCQHDGIPFPNFHAMCIIG